MEVIFLKSVKNVAQRGTVKKVSDGYARNYLLPNKLAALATPELIDKYKQRQQHAAEVTGKFEKELNDFIKKINNLKLTFTQKSSKEGTLFKGLGKEMIIQKIKEKTGRQIKENDLILDRLIKRIGQHDAKVRINNKDYPIIIEVNR